MQRLPFEPAVLFLDLAEGGSVGPGEDLRLLTIVASGEKILEDSQHLTGKRCAQQLGDLGCSRIEANWGYALVGKADNLKNRIEGKLEEGSILVSKYMDHLSSVWEREACIEEAGQ